MGQGQRQARAPLAEDPAPMGPPSPPAARGAAGDGEKQGLAGTTGRSVRRQIGGHCRYVQEEIPSRIWKAGICQRQSVTSGARSGEMV